MVSPSVRTLVSVRVLVAVNLLFVRMFVFLLVVLVCMLMYMCVVLVTVPDSCQLCVVGLGVCAYGSHGERSHGKYCLVTLHGLRC